MSNLRGNPALGQIDGLTINGNYNQFVPWIKPKNTDKIIPLFIQGQDTADLQFVELSGRETLSTLQAWTLTFDSAEKELDGSKIARAKVAVLYDVEGAVDNREYTKAFTGIIWNVYKPIGWYYNAKAQKNYYRYKVQVVPKFEFLRHHIDCRVFVKQTIKQILQSILKDEHKLSDSEDYKIDIEGVASSYEFPVVAQYQESDWAFIQRLMMKSGIYSYVEHKCTAEGEITHVMHFTDKKPETVAKAPAEPALSKPKYLGRQNGADVSKADWIGCFGWQAFDCPMQSQVTVDGYAPLEPTKALLHTEDVDAMGMQVTEHKSFGFYRPQQGHIDTSTAKNFAEVMRDQYNVFQLQARVYSNLPGYDVMGKFTADADWVGSDTNSPIVSGFKAGDYLVWEINFHISLASNDNMHYAAPTFSMSLIPLKSSTPAPCPFFDLPEPKIEGAKLRCVVVNHEGKYDDDAVKAGNRVANDDNMRSPYVGFTWDQAKRTLEKEDITAVPVQYYAAPGVSALPMVGAWALVEFISMWEAPIFLGVQHHKQYEPYEGDMKQNGETHFWAQPVNGTDSVNVNRISMLDGEQPDAEQKKQILEMYAPGKFDLTAAHGSENAQAEFSIDEEGNITLGNASGASFNIKKNGDIVIENKNVTMTMSSEGQFTVEAKGNAGISSDKDMTLEAKGNVDINGGENMSLEGKAGLLAKTSSTMELQAQAGATVDAGMITIKSKANINLTASGMVNST